MSRMAPAERTDLLTIRVTPEEMTMAKRLAEADGVSVSGLVRQFIRRLHAERFPDGKRKAKTKRK